MTSSVAEQVVTEPAAVHLLGIRHHGPGSARSVLAALAELAPDVVLIELPAEAGDRAVISLIADTEMVPPVALLGYAADHPEQAVFYPFAAFSPEWQAMRFALAHDIPLRMIDLSLAHTLAARAPNHNHDEPRTAGPPIDPIAELAAAAGDDDPERWWEDVVEHRSSVDGFAAIAEAMTAVRVHSAPAAGIEARREATMREGIRSARRDGFQRIAVVCGAWHVPALDDQPVAELTNADRALLKGQPKVKVTLTWVPWTHRRLIARSEDGGGGYGAGVSSPGWYAHVFATGADHRHWFARVARLLRERDHLVSPEHLVSATRLAEGLAALRGRPRPGLAEVTDAAAAVLSEGRVGPLDLIHDRLVVGDDLGRVPSHAPMVPLARDLAAEQRRVRLKPTAEARTLELDLRLPLGRSRSQLLHRLWIIGVAWGQPDDGRGSSGSFRESWRLTWEPEMSVRLIEMSAYGTTVERAAHARLLDRASSTNVLADLVALAELALLANLPDSMPPLLDRISGHAAQHVDVGGLLDVLGPLARIRRYGDVRGTDAVGLAELFDGVAERACVGLTAACRSLDDDMAAAMADRLTATQGALALVDHPARTGAWQRALIEMATGASINGVLVGRAVRLLADAEAIEVDEVAGALSRALSYGTPAREGAAFVDGFLAGAGTVLIHDAGLLGLIDGWLATLPVDTFDDVVALLRRTFAAFEAGERRHLGELVSGRGDGRPPAPFGWDLDERRVAEGLATMAELLGIRIEATV